MTESASLSEGSEGQEVDYLFHASAEDFKKIPGSPIAYWASKSIHELFTKNSLSDVADTRLGMATADNNRFLRFWYEVDITQCNFISVSINEAKESGKKWFPYQKGGIYRKWFGNLEYLVNWENDGAEVRNFVNEKTRKVRSHNYNLDFIFKVGITWNALSSSRTSARYSSYSLFDNAGSSIFMKKQSDLNVVLAYMNSKVVEKTIVFVSPTLNFQPGDIASLPIHITDGLLENLTPSVRALKDVSVGDWNTYETSWDFTANPLAPSMQQNPADSLAKNYQAWSNSNQKNILEMQRLEEENNRLFIEAYGLQDELTPEVPLKEITLTVNPKYRYGGKTSDEDLAKRFQSDTACELISYAIGCMMGRYSLDRPGLVYAHAGNDGFVDLVNDGAYVSFEADNDGIIPITDEAWFADDATHRFVQFVKTVWGEALLSENLSFIADSLGLYALKPKASESPQEVIRRYLSTKFYKDHLKTYKKRPIYWLFSSGKQKAFECMVYLHRYNEATLSRMRTEYVIPLMGKYASHVEQLQHQIDTADTTAQKNKATKALASLIKKQVELNTFDGQLKTFADMKISLDLDDGVKVNYAKFGTLLSDVKAVTGKK